MNFFGELLKDPTIIALVIRKILYSPRFKHTKMGCFCCKKSASKTLSKTIEIEATQTSNTNTDSATITSANDTYTAHMNSESTNDDSIYENETTTRYDLAAASYDLLNNHKYFSESTKQAMTWAHFLGDIWHRYINIQHKCEFLNENEYMPNILQHVIIFGGACRDYILGNEFDDIDMFVNTRELSKLHLEHLKKYHSKSIASQGKNVKCCLWKLYSNKFIKNKDINHKLNAQFLGDILIHSKELINILSIKYYPVNTIIVIMIKVLDNVMYKGYNLKGCDLDIADTFKKVVNKDLQDNTETWDEVTYKAKIHHQKSQKLYDTHKRQSFTLTKKNTLSFLDTQFMDLDDEKVSDLTNMSSNIHDIMFKQSKVHPLLKSMKLQSSIFRNNSILSLMKDRTISVSNNNSTNDIHNDTNIDTNNIDNDTNNDTRINTIIEIDEDKLDDCAPAIFQAAKSAPVHSLKLKEIKLELHKAKAREGLTQNDFSVNTMVVFLSDVYYGIGYDNTNFGQNNENIKYEWKVYGSISRKHLNNGMKDIHNKYLTTPLFNPKDTIYLCYRSKDGSCVFLFYIFIYIYV